MVGDFNAHLVICTTYSCCNVAAVVGGLSFCLGPIISGSVVSRIKLSVTGALKFIMIINMTSCIGFIVMGFLGCDNPQWAGALALDK